MNGEVRGGTATPPRGKIRAVPNLISASRVILAIWFVIEEGAGARLAIVGLAGFTDVLDGWIARRARVTSKWGALIDPIADRIFALTAVTTFLMNGALSTGAYLVFLSRDIMTAIGFIVAKTIRWLRPITFKARMSGKVVTVLQFVTFVALLAFPGWVRACLWAVGLASAVSVVDYTLMLWRERVR